MDRIGSWEGEGSVPFELGAPIDIYAWAWGHCVEEGILVTWAIEKEGKGVENTHVRNNMLAGWTFFTLEFWISVG